MPSMRPQSASRFGASFLVAALLAALAWGPAAVRAQEPSPSGPHHPLAQFEATKSPLAAGLLDLAVPLAGHAYAGDWKRGRLPAGVSVLSAGVAFVAIPRCVADVVFDGFGRALGGAGDEGDTTACSVLGIAFIGYGASRAWGGVSAYRTAAHLNRERRLPGQPEVRLSPGPGSLAVELAFRW